MAQAAPILGSGDLEGPETPKKFVQGFISMTLCKISIFQLHDFFNYQGDSKFFAELPEFHGRNTSSLEFGKKYALN